LQEKYERSLETQKKETAYLLGET